MHDCVCTSADPLFAAVHGSLDKLLDPILFTGRAPQQVTDFMTDCVNPLLATQAASLDKKMVDSVNV